MKQWILSCAMAIGIVGILIVSGIMLIYADMVLWVLAIIFVGGGCFLIAMFIHDVFFDDWTKIRR